MIKKVETYRDEAGREVKSYSPISGDGKTQFSGKVRVRISPAMNDSSQVFERDFEFPMTEDIVSIEMAFGKFDEICTKRINERKDKILKKSAKKEETPVSEKT